MKCIKSHVTGIISRVHDDIAAKCIKDYPGKVSYVPKSEWKEARRVQAVDKAEAEQAAKDTAKEKAAQARVVKKEAKKLKLQKRSK